MPPTEYRMAHPEADLAKREVSIWRAASTRR
jgi:hypothetical protein